MRNASNGSRLLIRRKDVIALPLGVATCNIEAYERDLA